MTKASVLLWLRRDGKHVVRTLLVVEAAWWAFDLAMPWPTFPISRIYDVMAKAASEPQWAILFAIDAMFCLSGFRGGSLRRVGSASVDGVVHAIVVTSALVSAPGGTGTGTQAVFLLASYLLLEWEVMDA